jgi:hypothetical protein
VSGPHLTNDQLDPNWQSVPDGTPVYTADRRQLGTVLYKRDLGLYVRGSGPDIYLVTPQDIARVEPDGVYLVVKQGEALVDQTPEPPEASGESAGQQE